jgi:hypothetical protein
MDENRSAHGNPRRSIDLREEGAVRYWTSELQVTEEELRTVVGQVGTDPDVVKAQIAAGHSD